MKRIAYYALHYGAEYLAWSIRSIQHAVDEIHILYSPTPTFGHGTHLLNPDTEANLQSEVHRFATKPIFWHTGQWNNEGEHRTAAIELAKKAGADQVLWVDADELWDADTLTAALDASAERDEGVVRVRFVHFYRSFGWICEDATMPTRIINVGKEGEWYLSPQEWPVLHMGYAQSEATIRYKQDIHGHKAEWRPEWFHQKFLGWIPGIKDVHPTCRENFWEPKAIDVPLWNIVTDVLYDHPYYEHGGMIR